MFVIIWLLIKSQKINHILKYPQCNQTDLTHSLTIMGHSLGYSQPGHQVTILGFPFAPNIPTLKSRGMF